VVSEDRGAPAGAAGSHKGMKYIHWNMRDINYGFAAIEHLTVS
jgi:hypothetical protein